MAEWGTGEGGREGCLPACAGRTVACHQLRNDRGQEGRVQFRVGLVHEPGVLKGHADNGPGVGPVVAFH
jgi:hypothetical protein